MKTRGWFMIAAGAAVLALAGGAWWLSQRPKAVAYTNPLKDDGGNYADPWFIKAGKEYYYCGAADGNRLFLKHSQDATKVLTEPDHDVYTAPLAGEHSSNLWAPELHYLAGRWYIYYAADDGENANHRMFVLAGGTDREDPLAGKFKFAGKVSTGDDHWAIDGTVLELHGQHYFIWSGWTGRKNVAQNLYVAKMKSPTELTGERHMISAPDQSWEQHGKPYVNEAPQVLQHSGRTFVIYSASGSWTDEYCMGQLELTGNDPLNPAAWHKHTQGPVFKQTAKVFGPGHCSFIKSPSGQDYLIYHAARKQGSGWDRNIRMQPFRFSQAGTPQFGKPATPGKQLEFK